jgi:hypothetical protein
MRIALEFAHFIIGALVVLPLVVLPFAGAGEVLAGNARTSRDLGRATTVFGAIALGVALLGLLLISYVPNVTILTPWLGISVLLYAAAIALSLGVTAPQLRAAGESLAHCTAARTGRITASGAVTTACLTAVVVLMVWKP